jgi:hypothetical protein
MRIEINKMNQQKEIENAVQVYDVKLGMCLIGRRIHGRIFIKVVTLFDKPNIVLEFFCDSSVV